MLTKLTPAQLQSVFVLSHQPQWKGFADLLDAELETTLARLVDTPNDRELHVLQGRAKLLTELQTVVRDARVLLEKMGSSTPL